MPSQDIAGRIAHDLKATLSPIRTSAYVLRQGRLIPDATHRELVEVIERQTVRLARMMDEVVDWQRALAGTLVSRNAPQDVAILMDLVAGALRSPAVVSWPQGEMPPVAGDRHRLEQMLVALIDYCARRDPVAPPRVEVTCTERHVRFCIADRGPPADLDTLFNAPIQEAPDAGLGLGLILARAIAQAHHGELHAHAPDSGGLRFECMLPRAN